MNPFFKYFKEREMSYRRGKILKKMVKGKNLEKKLNKKSKARFPLGEFVCATRSENKNPATWLVKIGWRKNSPRTSRKRSYFFVCSREQIRQVENSLKTVIGWNTETSHYQRLSIVITLHHAILIYPGTHTANISLTFLPYNNVDANAFLYDIPCTYMQKIAYITLP